MMNAQRGPQQRCKRLDTALREAGYTRASYMIELERQLVVLRTRLLLLAPKVMIDEAEVAAELERRSLPPTDDNKQTVTTELRGVAMEKLQVRWLADLRKRAYISRRP